MINKWFTRIKNKIFNKFSKIKIIELKEKGLYLEMDIHVV